MLLDVLIICWVKGWLYCLIVVICGDIVYSCVVCLNLFLLGKMENWLWLVGFVILMFVGVCDWGCEVYEDMCEGLKGVDVVMMLCL